MGEVLSDHYSWKIPADSPPGPAPLTVSVSGAGTATLTTLAVQAVEHSFLAPQPATLLGYDFGGQLTLHSYDLVPGATTVLTLFWQPLAESSFNYTVFVHVLDANGVIVAQADAEPRGGSYPTSMWVPGEYVTDPYTFALASGRYSFELGVYRPESGERLPVFDAQGQPAGDLVRLPPFDVP